MKIRFKTIIGAGLVISLLFNSFTSFAIKIADEMNDQIIQTTNLLEDILKDEYEESLNHIKEKAINEGYDLELTLEALGEQSNIFSDVDYITLIAAYITISDNNISICDLNFYDVDYEEATIEEPKPYKYYNYTKNDDGSYTKGSVAYLTEDGYIEEFKKESDGTYRYVGQQYIELETQTVKYLNPTIRIINADDVLNIYGGGAEKEHDEYASRLEILKAAGVSSRGLRESIMLSLYTEIVLTDEEQTVLANAISTNDLNRGALVQTAASLIGRVPYQWGGKPKTPGYDNFWWTFNDKGEQIGLDCSGFVQWVYRTSGYSNYGLLGSTQAILNNCETISEDELQIGDIGLLNHGEKVNHTGIYIGNGYWIHCSSSKDTVIVSQFPFTIYKRAPEIENVTLTGYVYEDFVTEYSAEEVYLLSQLVSHEAAGEGLNGWIAVAEVVMNRVESNSFPNSIESVVYDSGQFESVEEIADIVPSANIIAAVDAVLSKRVTVLNNSNIYYFRNPGDCGEEDWGGLKAYTRINNHVFYFNPNK